MTCFVGRGYIQVAIQASLIVAVLVNFAARWQDKLYYNLVSYIISKSYILIFFLIYSYMQHIFNLFECNLFSSVKFYSAKFKYRKIQHVYR